MSTPENPDTDVPMTECRVCQVDVPDAKFCGLCGIRLQKEPGDGPDWLRIKQFGAEPGEHLLRPSLASSLFPHLPKSSRRPFQIGLVLLLVALLGATFFRLPAVLITVAALGLLLLFNIYLVESDALRDLPTRTLTVTVVTGILLGVGWVLLTGAMMARAYNVPLGTGISGYRVLRDGLGVPIGGMILMLVPVLAARLTRPPHREALDGYMIGVLGALCFAGAATFARLAPQFTTGMVARQRPLTGLIVEAGIRGIAVPLTAAAVGGLVGAALWFRSPDSKAHKHRQPVRIALIGAAAAVLLLYSSLGLIDIARFPQVLQLCLHLTVTAIALFVLRVGLHLALLHEAHDEIQSDQPVVCPHCGHVVPDMAFCPACGAATHAASRSSRGTRRDNRPVRIDEPGQP